MKLKSLLLIVALCCNAAAMAAADAEAIVRDAINHWRGLSSLSEMTMIIHRPDWQRSMSMRGWTKGEEKSLVRVIAPTKDRGNATLTIDKNMWSFAPKVNRVIKIPSSMMGQSWMGSDFSNKDIARGDDMLDDYSFRLLASSEDERGIVHTIEAIPHDDAAVVWGREIMQINDDHVLLKHEFYDQDGELVKVLDTLQIAEMGGRAIARKQRMGKVDTPDEWTEIVIDSIAYDVELADSLFTQSNLRNPRD